MAGNKMLYIAVGVIAAVAIVAVGVIILLSDNEGEYDHYLGKYQKFDVSGSSGAYTFDGSVNMEFTKIKGSMVTATYTYDVYQTVSGVRTPLLVSTEEKTVDASKSDYRGVWQSSETISTKWGPKAVGVYLEADGVSSSKIYVDKDNYEIAYRMVVTQGGVTLTYTLTETNFF